MSVFKKITLIVCLPLFILANLTNVSFAHILSSSEEWSIGRQASLKYESINYCVEDSDLEEIYQDILNSNNLPKKVKAEVSNI